MVTGDCGGVREHGMFGNGSIEEPERSTVVSARSGNERSMLDEWSIPEKGKRCCACRKIKSEHIGDAVRPRLGDKECARRDRRRARPAHLSPGIDACGPHCNISCNRAAGDGGGAR